MSFNYSIVATTYNDEANITRYLSEMINQTLQPSEIIIADGGSSDKTVERIRDIQVSSFIPIRVITGKRLNIAEGYNCAIKAAQYKYVGVTGLGNRYEKFYFEKLQKMLGENDGVYSPIRGYNSTLFSRIYNSAFLHGKYGDRMKIASNHGVLIKRKAFEDIGYFYEKFIYAGEDTEFYEIVEKRRYKILLNPDAIVKWETPRNIKEFKKQIKVYIIAGMQINPEKEIAEYKRNIRRIYFGVCSLIVFLSCIFLSLPNRIKFFAAGTIVIIWIVKWNFLRPIRFLQVILKAFYFYQNKKYLDGQFTVRR